jgi:hypothetical protein
LTKAGRYVNAPSDEVEAAVHRSSEESPTFYGSLDNASFSVERCGCRPELRSDSRFINSARV